MSHPTFFAMPNLRGTEEAFKREELRGCIQQQGGTALDGEEGRHGYKEPYETRDENLLENLISHNDLVGHLKTVKHYFLMDRG